MTPTKTDIVTDQEIVDFIQIKLGWVVDGTAEVNDMIKTADFVRDRYETQLEEMRAEREKFKLITDGAVEGAENWKSEYDSCRAILEELVFLKKLKDEDVETIKTLPPDIPYGQIYKQRKPLAWEAAKEFLKEYQHINF